MQGTYILCKRMTQSCVARVTACCAVFICDIYCQSYRHRLFSPDFADFVFCCLINLFGEWHCVDAYNIYFSKFCFVCNAQIKELCDENYSCTLNQKRIDSNDNYLCGNRFITQLDNGLDMTDYCILCELQLIFLSRIVT